MEIKNLIDRLDDWDGVDAIYNGEFVEVNHHGVFRLLEEAAAALEQLQAENDRLKEIISCYCDMCIEQDGVLWCQSCDEKCDYCIHPKEE